jgi:hypothetical protein
MITLWLVQVLHPSQNFEMGYCGIFKGMKLKVWR